MRARVPVTKERTKEKIDRSIVRKNTLKIKRQIKANKYERRPQSCREETYHAKADSVGCGEI